MSDNSATHKEAFWLLAHNRIGAGVAREVWDSRILIDSVIKVEETSRSFQNIAEWQVWESVKHTEFAKWFAPCEHISPCGTVLVMAKTTPAHKYPDKMPVFLTDLKHANYGMYKGRLVCHDYGLHLLHELGMSNRMRKADWYK